MSINKTTSVLLIDNNYIDNFINKKILENYGVMNTITFRNAYTALSYLVETPYNYQLIIADIYLPLIDGFEFIDKFNQLELYKKHGRICLLSASLNPEHKKQSSEMNVRFIEKPLTIEKLLITG